MMANNQRLLLYALMFWLCLANMLCARIWTHQDGRTFEGDLIELKGDVATIRRDVDQRVFQVNMAVLSEDDREYLEDARKEQEAFQAKVEVKQQVQRDPVAQLRRGMIQLGILFFIFIFIYYLGCMFQLGRWSFLWSSFWQILYFGTMTLLFLGLLVAYFVNEGSGMSAFLNQSSSYFETARFLRIAMPVFTLVYAVIMAAPSSWMLRATYLRTLCFLISAHVLSVGIGILANWLLLLAGIQV